MTAHQTQHWRDMAGAPRDGTSVLVEVRASEQGPAEIDLVRWANDGAGAECWIAADSDPGCAIFYSDAELSGWMPIVAPLPKLRTPRPARLGGRPEELGGSGI
jgi:holo-[acyl-carrier protein] synthase